MPAQNASIVAGAGERVAGAGGGHDERVEPAARQQRGEQAGAAPRARRAARRASPASTDAEAPLQPRRRERAGHAHAERGGDRRRAPTRPSARPRAPPRRARGRRAVPRPSTRAPIAPAATPSATYETRRPPLYARCAAQFAAARARAASGVRADESAAHRRAVDAADQAGDEHAGEQGHEPAARRPPRRATIAVKCTAPRLTSKRSSHRPPWCTGKPRLVPAGRGLERRVARRRRRARCRSPFTFTVASGIGRAGGVGERDAQTGAVARGEGARATA